ncbi:MAG: 2-isopropylmalate synthase [Firmicutes bacterium]|nr:2-isopropylmalate synthase [Bacillota bacterium]
MRRVRIFDTTLRDGEQTPGVSLLLGEKVEIAHALADLGVDVVEAGFPAAAPAEAEAVAAIARSVRGVAVAALSRTTPADLEAASRALEGAQRPRMHVFSSASEVHIRSIFQRSREEVVEDAVRAVETAAKRFDDVEFSPQDATRSDVDFLVGYYRAVVEAGATVVNIPDTVGYAWPWQMYDLVRRVREALPPEVQVSVHCHDDLGLAVANSLASLLAGADQVECTVNGIGERAGNASLEEIVTAMRVRPDVLPFDSGVRSDRLVAVSRLVAERTGVVVQPNKAVVGANAFRHESGIHQDGLLKDRGTYEIIDPASVGAESRLVIGKHSGRHALRRELQALGFFPDEAGVRAVWQEVKAVAARRGDLSAEALRAIAARILAPAEAPAGVGES